MKVGPRVSSEVSLNLDAARAADARAADDAKSAAEHAPRIRTADRVELSDAARTMAEATALSDDEVSAIRGRIASGAYNAPRVIDVVARRILARGDV